LRAYSERRRRNRRYRWYWLLAPVAALPLAAFWYNSAEPRLGGFPFFYWGQLALIFFVALATYLVHVLAGRGR
jgi:Protein of unknown function (DUF3311)